MFYQNLILFTISLAGIFYIWRFWRNSRGKIRITLTSALVLLLCWPAISIIFHNIAVEQSRFFLKLMLAAIALTAPFFWLFTYYFPEEREEKVSFSLAVKIFILPILITILVFYGQLFISGIYETSLGRMFTFTRWFQFYVAYSLIYLIAPAARLFKKIKTIDNNVVKNQINYFLTGYLISALFGWIAGLLMVGFNNSRWLWIGAAGSIFAVYFCTKALLEYQLIDIRYVLRKSIIFNFVFALVLILYTSLVFIFSLIIFDYFNFSSILLLFIIPLFLAVGYKPLKTKLITVTRRFLFFQDYNADEVISKINNILKTELDLKQVVTNIMEVLHDVFSPKKILFFLAEKQCLVPYQQVGLDLSKEDVAKFNKLEKFCSGSGFFNYLKKRKTIIDVDNLKYSCRHDSKSSCDMVTELIGYSVSLVVPVHGSKELVGCLFLEDRKSEEIYSPRVLNLLEVVANQIASYIENARLYTELQDFNVALQKKVKKATSKLRETNKKLKELVDAKSEFVSIVAHQLRAPLTVIKGYLSMLHDGTMGNLTEEQNMGIMKAYRSNNDLIDLVENLLNFARINDNKISYNISKVHFDEVATSVLEQFEIQLKEKQLKINVAIKPKDLPTVKGDFNKLKNVVANLLDNAIKYTDEGGKIDINIAATGKEMVFEMTDNGIGMVPSDAEHLFEKFFRNQEMSFKHIQGTGMGLYIVQRFITALGGRVWASSPGRGKGSTFGFSLPRS